MRCGRRETLTAPVVKAETSAWTPEEDRALLLVAGTFETAWLSANWEWIGGRRRSYKAIDLHMTARGIRGMPDDTRELL